MNWDTPRCRLTAAHRSCCGHGPRPRLAPKRQSAKGQNMDASLPVDSVRVEPGQTWKGYAAVALGPAHVHLPLIIANGARPGPRLALTAGVHYGEFIGIEALRGLMRQIDPAA